MATVGWWRIGRIATGGRFLIARIGTAATFGAGFVISKKISIFDKRKLLTHKFTKIMAKKSANKPKAKPKAEKSFTASATLKGLHYTAGIPEKPKPAAPPPKPPAAKKKPTPSVSVLDKLHLEKSVQGESKYFPFSNKKLPFDRKDVVVVKAGKKAVTVCLTSLRGENTLGIIASYLNNKRGVSAEQAAQIIADCIVDTTPLK